MEMEFKLKWIIDGEARYYLGLARGMGLARQEWLYTYIHTTLHFPPKEQASKSTLSPLSLSHSATSRRRKKKNFLLQILIILKS